jgi:hypothetical protein
MNPIAKFSLAVAFAGMAATPFGSAQADKNQLPTITAKPQMACPIVLEAEHSPDGSVRRVKGEAPHEGVGQQLQIAVTNSKMAAITSVQLAVHGWSGKGRTLPAQKADESNGSKTVDVTLRVAPLKTADANVWVSGLTSVNAIDLIGVDYADGSNWKPTATDACHFTPNGVMLISEK